ncbi:hypothetical protein cypCar_00001887 [Cyprinus carpio]|nr:hypothetical protein cypCar_00001887 [Cyprinus carpio]
MTLSQDYEEVQRTPVSSEDDEIDIVGGDHSDSDREYSIMPCKDHSEVDHSGSESSGESESSFSTTSTPKQNSAVKPPYSYSRPDTMPRSSKPMKKLTLSGISRLHSNQVPQRKRFKRNQPEFTKDNLLLFHPTLSYRAYGRPYCVSGPVPAPTNPVGYLPVPEGIMVPPPYFQYQTLNIKVHKAPEIQQRPEHKTQKCSFSIDSIMAKSAASPHKNSTNYLTPDYSYVFPRPTSCVTPSLLPVPTRTPFIDTLRMVYPPHC